MSEDGKVQTQTLTIQGKTFKAPKPYAEGHTCTTAEAAVLNANFAENLRNNFAKVVKRGGKTDAELQAEFDTYAKAYNFDAKSLGHRLAPEEREAQKLARQYVHEALRRKGIKADEVSLDRLTAEVARVAALPQVITEARKRLAAMRDIAVDVLEGE